MIAALAVACGDDNRDVSWQRVDGLEYAMPLGWTVRDRSEPMRKIFEWTPDENANRESVIVIRTQPLVALTKIGLPRMQGLLAAASNGLPSAKFDEPTRIVTTNGFAGMRVDGTFVPTKANATYQRIHIVLLDGTSLVHVLYTARDASAEPEVLRSVLDSLQRKES